MTTNTLIRIGGFAALAVGAVAFVSNLGTIAGFIPATLDGYRSLATIVIGLFALTGLYAAQASKAGVAGLVGYVLGSLGLAGNVGLRFVFLFVAPILTAQYPEAAEAAGAGPLMVAMSITFLVYAIGYLIFGIATFRAGVFSRWAGVLFMVGAVLSYVLVMLPINVGGLLINVGLIWMGWSLAVGKVAPAMQTQMQTV